jgi:hypothetical protein
MDLVLGRQKPRIGACRRRRDGRPELRDPLKVLEDVSERLISRERAREVYRVANTSDLTVDQSATAVLRSQ